MGAIDTLALDALPSPDPSPPAVAEEREMAQLVLEAVRSLPPKEQEVVRLRFQDGFKYREISEITGLSVSHVGVLIHEAIKAIRKRLGSEAGPKGGCSS